MRTIWSTDICTTEVWLRDICPTDIWLAKICVTNILPIDIWKTKHSVDRHLTDQQLSNRNFSNRHLEETVFVQQMFFLTDIGYFGLKSSVLFMIQLDVGRSNGFRLRDVEPKKSKNCF